MLNCWLKVSVLCIAKFVMPICNFWTKNGVCCVLNFIHVFYCTLNLTQEFQAKKTQAEIILKLLVIVCARKITPIMFVYDHTCVFTR